MQLHRVDAGDGPMSRFSSEFRRALVCRYGRLPSAPFAAREFNLRHDGRRSISSESVRRWLQGDCLGPVTEPRAGLVVSSTLRKAAMMDCPVLSLGTFSGCLVELA
jgi:hypothetical protein